MFFFVFLCVVPVWGFIPVSPLTDCPNLPPQDGIKLEQVTGSWRLAYLFIDDKDELEEDNTCAVAEIMQVNDTKLEMLLYVDGKKDEYTIDRYTKEFDVTVISPGQWLLHTSFVHIEFIQVTVIGLSASHLILTFCINPYEPDELSQPIFPEEDAIDPESMDDIFKSKNYNKLWKDLDEMNKKLERHRRVRRPSRLLRGKRFAYPDYSEDDTKYEKLLKYLKENKSEEKPKKHLWTAILVKDNNISALRFVENASLLMKFGYKVTKGQLVSFGQCGLTKK